MNDRPVVRLWHDDIRPAPEGWVWARTNEAAQEILSICTVSETSLDHDLGLHTYTEAEIAADLELIFKAGQAEETGLDLVQWMIQNDRVPPRVTIHSWNPDGAKKMARVLNNAGHDCYISPFTVPETVILNID